jgi:flagellar biosynthesis protein FlhF
LKLKSYFSGTVESAVELARKELGEEALLVHARPATPETRYLGAYEVVFGLMPPSSPAAPAVAQDPSPFRGEIDSLRRQIERLTHSFESPRTSSPSSLPLNGLLTEELDPELARKVASGVRLDDLVSVDSSLAPRVALVGPPGVGKTTTLIKLAARYGLAQRKSVHIVTTDVQRIAAADQLRSLAAILGIGCDVADSAGALTEILREHQARDLIFIDTPGFSVGELKRDPVEATEFGEAFAGVDVHLLLSASMKPVDMRRVSDAFGVFHPAKLLFTRLDETTRYGALVNEAARLDLPISFLANGQQIPDDMEEATIQRLSTLILGERPLLSRGAAA